MVLYVTSQDCTRGAGSRVVVTLRPGNGSDGASHGLWRYVCCQRRPTMTLPSCRYTGVMAVSGYCTCVYLQDISRLLKKSYLSDLWVDGNYRFSVISYKLLSPLYSCWDDTLPILLFPKKCFRPWWWSNDILLFFFCFFFVKPPTCLWLYFFLCLFSQPFPSAVVWGHWITSALRRRSIWQKGRLAVFWESIPSTGRFGVCLPCAK